MRRQDGGITTFRLRHLIMAKPIYNSLSTFARTSSMIPLAVVSSIVVICLLIGLAMVFFAANWLLVVIFVVSLTGLAGFMYLNFSQTRRISSARDQKRIDWETALPEIQRQNLNLEVLELSKILEVEGGQISDLQSAYIVAEDLALRQIQQEENVPLMRHVTLGKAPFDAVLVRDDVIICVEVAFLVAPDIRQERIDAIMRKIALVKKAFEQMNIGMKVRLMMVLVTQLTAEDNKHLRSVLSTGRFSTTPVDIDIRLLDFETLQKIYVTE